MKGKEFVEKKEAIDVFIKNFDDIYASSNYKSLSDASLNNKLEKYLLNSIANYNLNSKIHLVIHIPAHLFTKETLPINKLITYHFLNKTKETELHLKQKFKQWRINLLIGSLFLILCFILLELFSNDSNLRLIRMFRESLLIVGWVAIWEPITFILFGWHPIVKKKLLYKKLANSSVSVEEYTSKLNNIRELLY